jgi:hypothetical protein
MTSKDGDSAAVCDIPQPAGIVEGGGGDDFAVGRIDRGIKAAAGLARQNLAAGLGVPLSHRPVV